VEIKYARLEHAPADPERDADEFSINLEDILAFFVLLFVTLGAAAYLNI